MLLTSLSNVGVVDLEVCCPIFGTFHSAPRYFNIIDRLELSVGRVPHSTMLEMLKIFWNGYHLLGYESRLEAPATWSDRVKLTVFGSRVP